jgi:hypothetical protein
MLFMLYWVFSTASNAQNINVYIGSQTPELIDSLQTELNKAGLKQITVKNTDFWHPYIQGLRQGRSGIYFAAPHFAAWAIDKHQFIPLLKLAGNLQYVLVSRRRDLDIFEVSDLVRKRICVSKAPNLDFILANSALSKSLNSPLIIAQQSVFNSMQNKHSQCDAFAVSEHLFRQHALKQPYDFIRLHQSFEYPNYAFISSPDIPEETHQAFKKLIQSKQIKTLLRPIYAEYSSKPILLSTKKKDYKELHNPYLEKIWAQ